MFEFLSLKSRSTQLYAMASFSAWSIIPDE